MAAVENAGSQLLKNIGWPVASSEDDVGLGERESVGTDFNEKSDIEDFMQKGKTEFNLEEQIESEVCSMCKAWQDIGDGFRFHLPDDLFTPPASLNFDRKEKWGDSDIEEEDEEKNFCEGETDKEEEEANQVECWVSWKT